MNETKKGLKKEFASREQATSKSRFLNLWAMAN